jgi:pyruvate/2-oxoglutarate dehydrogenase complex dihydrolipoamide dehydrogenase (E3) component
LEQKQANMDVTYYEIASEIRSGVDFADRKYHLSTYKNCFVGKEAVDFLLAKGYAGTREEAVRLGQSIMTETKLFEHVCRDHPFADANLFYHFIHRGEVTLNESTGEKFDWKDYVAASQLEYDAAAVSGMQPEISIPNFDLVPPGDTHVASHIWPLDEHNLELLNQVHPTGWIDPKPQEKYDLVVIGGGPAGLVAASGAAGVGARVAIIEANLLGGDCLNMGCVPSKSLLHAANLCHTLNHSAHLADYGVSINGDVKVDFGKVMQRIRKIRADISHHDSADRFTKELGVEVFIGRARFVSKTSVEVNGNVLCFSKAVIATGGYPSLIPMHGLQDLYNANRSPSENNLRPYVMTNETFFNMTKQPKNMIVVGPGVIGIELSQAMQRLGTSVTVLGRSGRILPKEDEDHAELIQRQLEQDGVQFRLSVSEYISVHMTGKVLENFLHEIAFSFQETIDGESTMTTIHVDAVLIATGRRPNVTGMELEMAGVEYDSRIGITVNDRLQTSNKHIFAAGDCCSPFKFTHAADFMARIVIRNALFFGNDKMSNLLIPYCTFCEPQVASVGLVRLVNASID